MSLEEANKVNDPTREIIADQKVPAYLNKPIEECSKEELDMRKLYFEVKQIEIPKEQGTLAKVQKYYKLIITNNWKIISAIVLFLFGYGPISDFFEKQKEEERKMVAKYFANPKKLDDTSTIANISVQNPGTVIPLILKLRKEENNTENSFRYANILFAVWNSNQLDEKYQALNHPYYYCIEHIFTEKKDDLIKKLVFNELISDMNESGKGINNINSSIAKAANTILKSNLKLVADLEFLGYPYAKSLKDTLFSRMIKCIIEKRTFQVDTADYSEELNSCKKRI